MSGEEAAAGHDPGTLERAATALYEAVATSLAGFVERSVAASAAQGARATPAATREAAREAARRAEADVLPRLRALLGADMDEQRSTPLEVVRRAVPFATAALDRLGAAPAARDRFQTERFPEDRYGLVPARLDALGDDVAELAIVWGAAKAMAHRRRHLGSAGGPAPAPPDRQADDEACE